MLNVRRFANSFKWTDVKGCKGILSETIIVIIILAMAKTVNGIDSDLFSYADSIRESLDRRIKLSIKRLVKYEVRPDRWENRVVV